jgi:hypothetical protein
MLTCTAKAFDKAGLAEECAGPVLHFYDACGDYLKPKADGFQLAYLRYAMPP